MGLIQAAPPDGTTPASPPGGSNGSALAAQPEPAPGPRAASPTSSPATSGPPSTSSGSTAASGGRRDAADAANCSAAAAASAGSASSETCCRHAPLMHRRCPVGAGPSLKTCPRWPPQLEQSTSVRGTSSEKSTFCSTASPPAGAQKEGHPDPESNFSCERKRDSCRQSGPGSRLPAAQCSTVRDVWPASCLYKAADIGGRCPHITDTSRNTHLAA